MAKISEEQLKSILWQDISILQLSDTDHVLILLCDTIEQSERLLGFLKDNAYDLKVFIDIETKEYRFQIDFLNSDYSIGYKSGRTKESYFPLTWLGGNKVNLISAGIKLPDGNLMYDQYFHELDRINFN